MAKPFRLTSLTSTQLERLFNKAYKRMAHGDGYQPYGYDWNTIRLTKPGWYHTLQTIRAAWDARMDAEMDMLVRINHAAA